VEEVVCVWPGCHEDICTSDHEQGDRREISNILHSDEQNRDIAPNFKIEYDDRIGERPANKRVHLFSLTRLAARQSISSSSPQLVDNNLINNILKMRFHIEYFLLFLTDSTDTDSPQGAGNPFPIPTNLP
jgi:hypothetical protein